MLPLSTWERLNLPVQIVAWTTYEAFGTRVQQDVTLSVPCHLFLCNAMFSMTIWTSSLESPNALPMETTIYKLGKNSTSSSQQVQISLETPKQGHSNLNETLQASSKAKESSRAQHHHDWPILPFLIYNSPHQGTHSFLLLWFQFPFVNFPWVEFKWKKLHISNGDFDLRSKNEAKPWWR